MSALTGSIAPAIIGIPNEEDRSQIWQDITGFQMIVEIDVDGEDSNLNTVAHVTLTGANKVTLSCPTRVNSWTVSDGEYYMEGRFFCPLSPYVAEIKFIGDQITNGYSEGPSGSETSYNLNVNSYLFLDPDSYGWNDAEAENATEWTLWNDCNASVAVVSGPSSTLQSTMEGRIFTEFTDNKINWRHALNMDGIHTDGFVYERTINFDDGLGRTVTGTVTIKFKVLT